jgi:hypothetical protein
MIRICVDLMSWKLIVVLCALGGVGVKDGYHGEGHEGFVSI